MSKLGQVIEAVEKHSRFVLDQVKRARTDDKFARELIERWNKIKAETPITHAPTGLPLPRLALPEIDEPGEIARYLFGDGLPGGFPYLNAAYSRNVSGTDSRDRKLRKVRSCNDRRVARQGI